MPVLVALEGAAIGAIIVILSCYITFTISKRLFPSEGMAVRWCAAGILLIWLMIAGFEALGLFNLFRPVPAMLLLAAIATIVRLSIGRCAARRPGLLQEMGALREQASKQLRNPDNLIYYPAAFLLLFAMFRAILSPPMTWDSLTYHLFKAAKYAQNGGPDYMLAPIGWLYYRMFPPNGEISVAWAMLPFHSDTIALLVDHLYWWLLLLAFYALLRDAGVKRKDSVLGAFLLGFMPSVFSFLNSGYVDIAVFAEEIVFILFLLRALRWRRAGDLVIAFVALGCALGTKYTALPLVSAALLLFALPLFERTGERSRLLPGLCAGVALCAAVSAPCYLINAVHTGSPIYPFPLHIAGFEIFSGDPSFGKIVSPMLGGGGALREWLAKEMRDCLHLLRPRTMALGLLGAVALIAGPVGFWTTARKRPWETLVLLGVIAVTLAAFFSNDIAGIRQRWGVLNARFLNVPVAIMLLGAFKLAGRDERTGTLMRYALMAVFLSELIIALPAGWLTAAARFTLVIVFFFLFLISAMRPLGRRMMGHFPCSISLPRRLRLLPAAAIVMMLLFLIAHVRPSIRYELYASHYELHPIPAYGIESWAHCDDVNKPLRLAFVAGGVRNGDNWFWYPLLGTKLQNEVLYVPRGAQADAVSHNNSLPGTTDDFHCWLERLIALRIDKVVSFPPVTAELSWMDSCPDLFEKEMGNVEMGVYAFNSEAAAQYLKVAHASMDSALATVE